MEQLTWFIPTVDLFMPTSETMQIDPSPPSGMEVTRKMGFPQRHKPAKTNDLSGVGLLTQVDITYMVLAKKARFTVKRFRHSRVLQFSSLTFATGVGTCLSQAYDFCFSWYEKRRSTQPTVEFVDVASREVCQGNSSHCSKMLEPSPWLLKYFFWGHCKNWCPSGLPNLSRNLFLQRLWRYRYPRITIPLIFPSNRKLSALEYTNDVALLSAATTQVCCRFFSIVWIAVMVGTRRIVWGR